MNVRDSSLTTATSRFEDNGCIPQPVPFARSLLSRLTGGRNRARPELFFAGEVSRRKYAAGDTVKDFLIVELQKPMRITHIVVRLQGYVQVFKGRASSKRPTPSRSMKAGDYSGGTLMLFDEESVVCGEERLEPGRNRIPFELKFPTRALPTSLDCERGTICYLLRAVLTRPTGLASTMTAEIDLPLEERIDVAYVHPPKPRMISLEPLKRRRTRRTAPGKEKGLATPTATTHPALSDTDEPSVEASINAEIADNGPRSPSPSHVSHGSFTTSSANSQNPSHLSQNRTITASIELHKAGCLRGDTLPVKVVITHVRPKKSMMGVIVTLYRQARFDTSPIWPDDPTLDGKSAGKAKHNDIYPKSMLGLGGLSLSSDGTARTFKKELAQSILPLIVDDKTLTCTVKAAVRVPEDAFPTINCVPGMMVNFKYFVEVVVDLGGKLDGQEKHMPGLNRVNLSLENGGQDMTTPWFNAVVDTDQIRRVKSVVSCRFEVLVGTVDSVREAEKHQAETKQTYEHVMEPDHIDEEGYDVISPESLELYERPAYFPPPEEEMAHNHIPTPDIEQEDPHLDEKTRVRLAEERLMPSAPDYAASSSAPPEPSAPTADVLEATAPLLEDIHDIEVEGDFEPAPGYLAEGHGPAPSLTDGAAGPSGEASSSALPATDDKQELQRRRLLMEVSAPPGDEAETPEESAPEETPRDPVEPSAPALDELEEHHQRR